MNDQLVNFFREIADSIESDTFDPEQLELAGEFYMKYKFKEQAIRAGHGPNGLAKFEDENLMKFLVLGWYIYSFILEKE